MSRELNPRNVEDVEYLQGLPADDAETRRRRGVVRRVAARAERDRRGHIRRPATSRSSTRPATEYEPIALPATNPFSYQPTTVESDDGQPVQPDPESGAGSGPIQGSMLLFKLEHVGLREPPARARDRAARRRRALERRARPLAGLPAAGYSPGPCCSAAASTPRTAGAATSPPAPASGNSAPTAMRGRFDGAKATNQASVSGASCDVARRPGPRSGRCCPARPCRSCRRRRRRRSPPRCRCRRRRPRASCARPRARRAAA